MFMFGEGVVAPGTVHRDSNEFRFVFQEIEKYFIEDAKLVATHGTPVGGIKGQDNRFPAQFAQRESLVRRYVKAKLWCCRPNS
jgi:hypothetical protein